MRETPREDPIPYQYDAMKRPALVFALTFSLTDVTLLAVTSQKGEVKGRGEVSRWGARRSEVRGHGVGSEDEPSVAH